jgi:hypothetical protein
VFGGKKQVSMFEMTAMSQSIRVVAPSACPDPAALHSPESFEPGPRGRFTNGQTGVSPCNVRAGAAPNAARLVTLQ